MFFLSVLVPFLTMFKLIVLPTHENLIMPAFQCYNPYYRTPFRNPNQPHPRWGLQGVAEPHEKG